MAKVKVPIKTPIYTNIDEEALSRFSPLLIDGYMDEEGNTHRRPGLTEFVDLGTGQKVDGLYWWRKYGYIIAVSGGRIWKITDFTGAKSEITGDTLVAGRRPTFAEDATYFFTANGGKIIHYNNAGTTTAMADADAPTLVTHVGWHDYYLLANNVGSNQFHWSDLATPLTWSALNFAKAESSPDDIAAINIAWREILMVGKESTEIFWDNGSAPFARLEGAYTEEGISAPYSLGFFDNTWFWLNKSRRFVRIDGRTPQTASTPFDKTIQALSTVSDALADLLEIDGRAFYVITFPASNKTIVFDWMLKNWYQWGYWNVAIGDYDRWLGNCICYARDWNKHLVGSRVDGKIYEMSSSVYNDDGDTMRTVRRTAHVDHETLAIKTSKSLELRLKRGIGLASGDEPYMVVRWRDNGKSTWGNDHQVSLGKIGDTKLVASLKRLGQYRTRQYEFILSDSVPLVLCDAEEDVEVTE